MAAPITPFCLAWAQFAFRPRHFVSQEPYLRSGLPLAALNAKTQQKQDGCSQSCPAARPDDEGALLHVTKD